MNYDFVQSEGSDSVERLTKMLVNNGYQTIVIVGGDAAFNYAINGIMSSEENVRQQVAIGLIPNGRGNDFATYWGFSEENDEQTIDWLIERRLRKIDVGFIQSKHDATEGGFACRYFINCANVGLIARIMKIKYKARRLLALTSLTYFASMLALLFQRLETGMKVRINEDQIDRKIMSMCIGNCHGYGQTPSAVPYNGMLDVTIVSSPEIKQLIEGMVMLFTGQFLNHKKVIAYRTPRLIHFHEINGATVSTDGVVLPPIKVPFEIGLKPEQIQFIIPR